MMKRYYLNSIISFVDSAYDDVREAGHNCFTAFIVFYRNNSGDADINSSRSLIASVKRFSNPSSSFAYQVKASVYSDSALL
jgi:hypothetical protein